MRAILALIVLLAPVTFAPAQDRDSKVRGDRDRFAAMKDWIYNDLDAGVRAAKAERKPLLVVFRCIPCEACQEFDDDVARRDPVIRDLLDEFVCIRIVQGNAIDLTRFQHDFDQSFAAYLMNPDLTIYGRFGTRSGRPEYEDVSLKGLREAMEAALRMHRDYDAVKASLSGKQVRQARYRTPRDYPSLAGKYGEVIDYDGKTAQSCLHCHQIREAERLVYRSASLSIPDEVLFPYPDPAVLGLKMDPKRAATVERVSPGSIAAAAGLAAGDEIATLAGQPLLSVADLQWVLHNTSAVMELPAQVRRGGESVELTMDLQAGWRRGGDLSWRATTWDLRRMGLGGMKLEEIDDDARGRAGLPREGMALVVDHVGEYGEHAVAKRAGFRRGDVLVSFDGRTDRVSESGLIAYAVQEKRPGDVVAVTVLRDRRKEVLSLPLQ